MKRFALIIISLTCIACSTQYSAQGKGFWGKCFSPTGYTDYEIDEGVYSVTFVSKQGATHQANMKRATYRAAQLTLEKGYAYFKILSSDTTHVPSGDYNLISTNITFKMFNDKPDDTAINAQRYIDRNDPAKIKDWD